MTLKHIVVTIADTKFQSQLHPAIYHTNDEIFGGSSSCELHEFIQTHLILVQKVGLTGTKNVTTRDSKAVVWRWSYTVNSNLNLIKPFIVLIMRHWKGPAAVRWLNLSKHTQYW